MAETWCPKPPTTRVVTEKFFAHSPGYYAVSTPTNFYEYSFPVEIKTLFGTPHLLRKLMRFGAKLKKPLSEETVAVINTLEKSLVNHLKLHMAEEDPLLSGVWLPTRFTDEKVVRAFIGEICTDVVEDIQSLQNWWWLLHGVFWVQHYYRWDYFVHPEAGCHSLLWHLPEYKDQQVESGMNDLKCWLNPILLEKWIQTGKVPDFKGYYRRRRKALSDFDKDRCSGDDGIATMPIYSDQIATDTTTSLQQ